MTFGRLRWLVFGLLAMASAGLLMLMSMLHAAFALADDEDQIAYG